MAGDWMKIELELPDKPEVHVMASILNIDSDTVVGKLLRVWQWFDKHTVDGNAKSVTGSLLDRITGVIGFADAMTKVNWMFITDDGLQVPNFQKHNGATAKNRAETARRVAKHRDNPVIINGGEKLNRALIPRPIREAVLSRDNHTCVYCSRPEGKYYPPETSSDAVLHVDHVIPVSRGGSNDILNLATACTVCNLFKSDRTPDECGLKWPVVGGVKLGNKKNVTQALPREEKRISSTDTSVSVVGNDVANLAEVIQINAKPNCPHQEIISLYHEIIAVGTRVKVWNGTRAAHLKARWNEDVKRQSLDYWRRLFTYCTESAFLMGRINGKDRLPFQISLEWIVKPNNFAKIIEQTYHREPA